MNAFCQWRAGRIIPPDPTSWYDNALEKAGANSLIGTPEEIMRKLEALRRLGVEYLILSCAGSRSSLRRFAHEIMPAFSVDEPH